MNKKKKVILYCGGGFMLGVFGAGVLTSLQERNCYDKIEVIYSASAGSFNSAYFLSEQIKKESSVYWEDLQRDFILWKNIFPAIIQRFWNRYISTIPENRVLDGVNEEHLINIISKRRKLDVNKIEKKNIPFFSKVFDLKKRNISYIDMKKGNIMYKLEASMHLVPYTHKKMFVNGKEVVDGGFIEPIGLNFLIKKHPNSKIVLIINEKTHNRGLKFYVKNLIEGIIASWMYEGDILSRIWGKEKKFREEISNARNNVRITLISPPMNNPCLSSTLDPKRLKILYGMGRKEGNRLAKMLKEL